MLKPGGARRLALCGLLVAAVGTGCSSLLGPDKADFVACNEGMECSGTPLRVSTVPPLVQIASGSFHTCGLTAEGVAWCWGSRFERIEAGAGAPAPVPGGHRFVAIGAGRYHNCALTAEGIAHCWSTGESGVRYCGPSECGATPVAVGSMAFSTLAVGAQHTCALDLSGAAWCWGFNWMGEVGSTRLGQLEVDPVQVPDGLTFSTIRANHGYTCALTVDGVLYCWGYGQEGQLATSNPPTCRTDIAGPVVCSPRPVAAGTTLRFGALSLGLLHGCALTLQQKAACWGDNGQGQLGDGTFNGHLTPAPTTNWSWSAIEAGGPVTCGIRAGGGTYCWGLNQSGFLGTGTNTESSTAPMPVAGGLTFARLSAGPGHICGLTSDGAAYCWGDNTALQLGG